MRSTSRCSASEAHEARNILRQLPHRHIVADPVKEFLQLYVYHPSTTSLHIPLRMKAIISPP